MKIYTADTSFTEFEKVATLFFEYYRYLHACNVPMQLAENGEHLWVESVMKSIGKTSVLVIAEDKGIISGFGHGQLKLTPDYLGNKRVGVVSHFFLLEKLRGGDAAKRMFTEMKTWFTEKHVNSIELQVVNANEIGLRFWKKMGFETELQQLRLIL